MQKSRSILLLILAAYVALGSLGAPFIMKGLAKKWFNQAVGAAGGDIRYDVENSPHELKGQIAGLVGPHFLGEIVVVNLENVHDPAAVTSLLDQMQGMHSIELLLLSGDAMTGSGIDKIAKMEALRILSVAGGNLADPAPLARSKSIEVLDLIDTHGVTARVLEQLARIPNLTNLNLVGSDIAGSSLRSFRDFPRLWELDLRLTAVTTDDLAALSDAPHLRLLTVDATISGSLSLEEVKKKLPRVAIKQPALVPAPITSAGPAAAP